jgi:hypothetical protein
VNLAEANMRLASAEVRLANEQVPSEAGTTEHDRALKKVDMAERNLAYEKMRLAKAEWNLLDTMLTLAMARADAADIARINIGLQAASSAMMSVQEEYDGLVNAPSSVVPTGTLIDNVRFKYSVMMNAGFIQCGIYSIPVLVGTGTGTGTGTIVGVYCWIFQKLQYTTM